MKAILLAGGKGTRLRPLTIHTPKPIVPIFERPFLHYQLDLLKQVPEIDEVILSLNYQPRRIEEIFGDGSDTGLSIQYVVEPAPLGTAGAVRYAGESLRESVVVFNGDVLTEVDLAAVIALHRERRAKATIVLTPVENPTAYGLVETDADGNIRRFLEKPKPDEITCNTINAGIYVLEPDTFDRIPAGHAVVDRAELLPVADRAGRDLRRLRLPRLLDRHRHAGEVHRRSTATSWTAASRPPPSTAAVPDAGSRRRRASRKARRSRGRASSTRARSSRPARASARTASSAGSATSRSTPWSSARSSGPTPASARRRSSARSILGRQCHIGRSATLDDGVVLGDKSVVTDFSRSMKTAISPDIFKAYDVRGTYPDEVHEERRARDRRRVRRLPEGAKRIAVGRDMRLSSPALAAAFIDGATAQGADVVDYGMIPTDMLYFAVARDGYDGGVEITASHNPEAVQRHEDGAAGGVSAERRRRASPTSAT